MKLVARTPSKHKPTGAKARPGLPVFEVLESRGFEVKLVEPGKLKSVPGRKTDVLDCQWIQHLHNYGLLQGSFVPPGNICILRSYTRQRGMLVEYAGRHVLHTQKALMQMNIQLHHVINDITGAPSTFQHIKFSVKDKEKRLLSRKYSLASTRS